MVKVSTEVLKSACSMKENKARKIIEETTKVVLNWKTLVDVKPANESITVNVPHDLREDPLIIVLMNKEMKPVAALGYDQKEAHFRLAETNPVRFVDDDSHLLEAEQKPCRRNEEADGR
ncbi:hypothetical protein [Bradyrhizobium sp. STM 3557]|uniref:hypothetical protein n=1 Tax=Bradyrhizobium sp. STM 3557 TaxID=578920 RepID=UPI00388D9BF1